MIMPPFPPMYGQLLQCIEIQCCTLQLTQKEAFLHTCHIMMMIMNIMIMIMIIMIIFMIIITITIVIIIIIIS